MTAEPMLSLYRGILKAAKHFPSKKRDRIIIEIKAEFRAKKGLSDPAQLAKAREVAERGLADLQSYLPHNRVGPQGGIDLHLRGACK
eukprot:CAMPEP_0202865560 /NCGR_PEP_ID=MMETSP1391-20130828/6232_1 /ASSEMBLY_ACC=CAM_ASM_000867 /TAXON_ID=1034604 /ORGANISM="Chlamydomonas leiostraca, Strain SAG 11-49" /LENGTH=86 /DNA_ID=CAMNT_0049545419 /DNA_START=36 /DNA_END=296 /DNA_ORIENTATION=-